MRLLLHNVFSTFKKRYNAHLTNLGTDGRF